MQNLSTALPHVVNNIRENWDNVQSIHVKTSSSASLPIWTCRLDEEEGGRWDGLTRVPVPNDTDEEVKKGKKRALVSKEEPGKKRKKSDMVHTEEPTSTPQASEPDPPPTGSIPSKGSRPKSSDTPTEIPKRLNKPTSKHPTKAPTKEPTRVEHKPARAAAVDFFDSDDLEDRPSPSKPSTSKTSTPLQSVESRASPGSKGERPSETKTILKSSKKATERTITDVPAKEKHVKFAVKPSDLKKRDRALGSTDKKIRSGGGKGASAKDGVLGKKVAVR